LEHYWLNFLDQSLSFGGAWWSVVPKIALDQGIMSIVDNTLYSLVLGVGAFRDLKDVLKDVQAAWKPAFIASIRFWPFVKLVQFTVIPIELQVLWEDVIDIVWICILSSVNNEGLSHSGMVSDEKPMYPPPQTHFVFDLSSFRKCQVVDHQLGTRRSPNGFYHDSQLQLGSNHQFNLHTRFHPNQVP
jgi:hypothetical protein